MSGPTVPVQKWKHRPQPVNINVSKFQLLFKGFT